jgi:RNA polymerase sigma factor for flagellar operon FliA
MYETKGLDLDTVLKRYSPMVQRLAHAMIVTVPANVEVGDLIQSGLEGLMDAQRNYKPATGVPFEAFALMKIRYAMLDELRRQDWIPKRMRDKRKALDAAIYRLTSASATGKVSEQEIAEAMDLTLADYQKMLGEVSNAQVFHYEDFTEARTDQDFLESIADDDAVNPERAAEKAQLQEVISSAIGRLPERQALILSLFYEQDLTYREMADILDLSIPRVHQIHAEAISRIRAMTRLGRKL